MLVRWSGPLAGQDHLPLQNTSKLDTCQGFAASSMVWTTCWPGPPACPKHVKTRHLLRFRRLQSGQVHLLARTTCLSKTRQDSTPVEVSPPPIWSGQPAGQDHLPVPNTYWPGPAAWSSQKYPTPRKLEKVVRMVCSAKEMYTSWSPSQNMFF